MNGKASFIVAPFPEITKTGIDFIRQDGGISATLNVQTIRLHPGAIKVLIENRLEDLSLPGEDQ